MPALVQGGTGLPFFHEEGIGFDWFHLTSTGLHSVAVTGEQFG